MHKKMKLQGIAEENISGSSSGLHAKTSSVPQGKTCAPIQESPEEEMSDESMDNTLLIETMAREQGLVDEESGKNMWLLSYDKKNTVSEKVVEINDDVGCDLKNSSSYVVQSPGSSLETDAEVIPTPPLVTEENLRFSLRNAQSNLERVDVKAAAVARKRDLEGLMKAGDQEIMRRGALMLRDNASNMMRICVVTRDETAAS